MLWSTHKDKTRISTAVYSNPCEVSGTCLGKVQAEPGVCIEFSKMELRRGHKNREELAVTKTAPSRPSERELRVCDAG